MEHPALVRLRRLSDFAGQLKMAERLLTSSDPAPLFQWSVGSLGYTVPSGCLVVLDERLLAPLPRGAWEMPAGALDYRKTEGI